MPTKASAPWKSLPFVRVTFRLGLYDPCNAAEPPEFIGQIFTDSHDDQAEMSEFIREFNSLVADEPGNVYCLGAFRVSG